MGKSSGSQTQTVQTNSTTSLPSWVHSQAGSMMGQANNVAANLKPQAIAQIAGLTPGQQSLIQSLMGNVGAMNPAFTGAQNTLTGLQGYTPQNVQAGQLATTNLDPYMNPFTKSVIDTSLATGRDELARTKNGIAADAVGAGAFGGSRHGVREGVADAEFAKGAAGLAAGLNAANFQQAQGAAGTDIAAQLAAAQANQQAGLAGAGLNLGAATGAGNLAGQQQQSYLNSLFAALAGQGQLQGQQQAQNQYDADVANANNQLGVNQLGIQQSMLQSILGAVPQTTQGTTTGTTTQGGGSGIMQGLGGALGLAQGLLTPLSSDGGFGSSLLGGLAGWLSDERAKVDHGKVGKSHGVDVHEWEYKGRPGQRFRGPMAQDVERSRYAGAVHTGPDGLKRVNQHALPNGLTVESVNPRFKRKLQKVR